MYYLGSVSIHVDVVCGSYTLHLIRSARWGSSHSATSSLLDILKCMGGGGGRVGERLQQTWYHTTIAVCMNHMKGSKYAWPAGDYNLASPVMSVPL